MRVVLDTNIFINAFMNIDENCKIILKREHNGEFRIIMSNSMNEELIRMLEKLMDELGLDTDQRALVYRTILRALRRTEPVEPTIKFNKCEDSDDNMFFACAIDGNADYIISKDKHIHAVKEKYEIKNKNNKPIKILYPDEFVFELDRLKLVANFNKR